MGAWQDFIAAELNEYVRGVILTAIKENSDDARIARREIAFNRFTVVLDFETGNAIIEDEFDTTYQGTETIGLTELKRLVGWG